MTAVALVAELRSRGVELTPTPDGNLRVRPASRLTPELLDRLREHKPAVLAFLSESDGLSPAPAAAPVPNRAELGRVLALPLDQLDTVLAVRVSWWPAPLWFVPTEADAEALVAAGEATRGAIWTARELLDLLAVPGITMAGARTVALAKLAVAGEMAEVRPIGPRSCHVCHGRDWWRSTAGRVACRRCHPPAREMEDEGGEPK